MSIYFFDKISKESIASFTPLRSQRQKAPGSGHILPLAAFVEISKKCLTSSGQCDIIFKYRLRKPVIGHIAGWSSSVARRAHNPKVVGSNPAPATTQIRCLRQLKQRVFCSKSHFGALLGHYFGKPRFHMVGNPCISPQFLVSYFHIATAGLFSPAAFHFNIVL